VQRREGSRHSDSVRRQLPSNRAHDKKQRIHPSITLRTAAREPEELLEESAEDHPEALKEFGKESAVEYKWHSFLPSFMT